MIGSELDAAGVHDPGLRAAYERCRHSTPSTARPSSSRPGCWRRSSARPCTRSTVSPGGPTTSSTTSTDSASTAQRADDCSGWRRSCSTAVEHRIRRRPDAARGGAHRADATTSPWELFDDFLTSMRMDLTVTDYPDRAALERYMYGSAEVIGLQLLPVLGTVGPRRTPHRTPPRWERRSSSPTSCATSTRICERGRVYLPADELAAHGVDRELLTWCHANRRTDPRVRRALAEQHAITRRVYESARKGIAMLAPRSRPCVAAAFTLYSEILDRIEDIDFAVFNQRATVGTARRLQVAGARAGPGLARAVDDTVGEHVDMDHWQYLMVLAPACSSPRRWRSSGRASTARPAAQRLRGDCRSPRSSSSGTRWPSPRTSGRTTRSTSPASSFRAASRSRKCCSSS